MTSLKDRILELMMEQKLSQQQFADMIHISPASLSSIFNNRTKPTLKHVNAIMESFPRINPTWLLSGVGDMFLPNSLAENSTSVDPSDVSLERPLFPDFDTSTPTESFVPNTSVPLLDTKSPTPIVKEVKVVETKIRQITEIRIFYEDQTWETFIPQK